MRAELERRFEVGGLEEAALRALIYIRLPEGSIDERGFSVLKLIRASRPVAKRMSLAQVQGDRCGSSTCCRLDEERAIGASEAAGRQMPPERKAALDVLHRVLAARGEMSGRRRAPAGTGRSAVRCQPPKKPSRRRRPMPDIADGRRADARQIRAADQGGAEPRHHQGRGRASLRRCLAGRRGRGGPAAPDRANPGWPERAHS